jgi:diaminopimelate decarboxylase
MPMAIIGHANVPSQRDYTTIDVVGYTCMEHDVLFEKYSGPVAAGDYSLFSNVGAYTIVMKPPFIRPAPPIITYNRSSGQFETLKRREEFDDVFAAYTF